jgi:YD repeat-containing protein
MPSGSHRQREKNIVRMPMKKPWYQKTATRYIPWLFTGFLLVGSILDSINNTITWVTPAITIVGTVITIIVFISLSAYLKRSPLLWLSEDGLKVYITDVGDWPKLIGIGILVALWLPRVISLPQGALTPTPTTNTSSSTTLAAPTAIGCELVQITSDVTIKRDSRGNIIEVADALGRPTRYDYDVVGNRVIKMDPMGNTEVCEYDDLNHLVMVKDAEGNTTSYIYDRRGNIIAITDPLGNVTKYYYDPNNNLIKIERP